MLFRSRVSRLAVAPGAPVRAGSPLADVELPVPVRVTSGGTSVLSFSGTADQQVSVTAPVDGVVAALLAVEGSSVTAGQPLLRLVDPARIRVTAFVSEADVTRVHAGQSAEVTLTSTGDTVTGVVQAVLPPAATATAPVGTADGKVPTTATTYPVYVRVDLRDQVALLGTSAAVRIRVK